MVTAKGLVREMQEAGFLTINEIKDILSIECSDVEIDNIIKKLRSDKVYKQFLVGNYKKCSCCSNLFTFNCFYEVRAGQLRSVCISCFKKQQKKYEVKRQEYNKKAYEKRKQKGFRNKNNLEAVRKSKLKKALLKKYNKKYNKKIIDELLDVKFNSCYSIKNNVLFNLCFDNNGNYLGTEKIKEAFNEKR